MRTLFVVNTFSLISGDNNINRMKSSTPTAMVVRMVGISVSTASRPGKTIGTTTREKVSAQRDEL